MYENTRGEIACLRELSMRYELEDAEILESYSNSMLAGKIYNGAGPDTWLPLAREVLTDLMSLFKPVVLIHDAQFFESDGSEIKFEHTVRVWEKNCRRIFEFEYPLLTWRMLNGRYRMERAYWYGVMRAGITAISGSAAFKAWKNAFTKRESESE